MQKAAFRAFLIIILEITPARFSDRDQQGIQKHRHAAAQVPLNRSTKPAALCCISIYRQFKGSTRHDSWVILNESVVDGLNTDMWLCVMSSLSCEFKGCRLR